MRRLGNLWNQFLDRENLRAAVAKALRAKRSRLDARAFTANLESHLNGLAAALESGTFEHGRVRQFVVFDPTTQS